MRAVSMVSSVMSVDPGMPAAWGGRPRSIRAGSHRRRHLWGQVARGDVAPSCGHECCNRGPQEKETDWQAVGMDKR
jgi:hypothetical protein